MSELGYLEHRTIAGDRWDLLAYRYYGDANLQSALIAANRHLYADTLAVPPLILPAGVALKVPIIQPAATNLDLLPPWKRSSPDYGTVS